MRVPSFAANAAVSPSQPLQTRFAASRVAGGAPTPWQRRAASAAAHPRLDAARTRCVACRSDAPCVARTRPPRWLARELRATTAVELALWLQSQDAAAAYEAATHGVRRAVHSAGSGCRATFSALRRVAAQTVLAVRMRRTSPAPRGALRLRCQRRRSSQGLRAVRRNQLLSISVANTPASAAAPRRPRSAPQLRRSCSISGGLEALFCLSRTCNVSRLDVRSRLARGRSLLNARLTMCARCRDTSATCAARPVSCS